MKGMARAIKRFAHRSGCIVIERCTWKKRKKIGHWALPWFSGGSAIGLSATGAWAILVSLDGAAADDSSNMRLILKTSETFCSPLAK
jgi:hypothetical protein